MGNHQYFWTAFQESAENANEASSATGKTHTFVVEQPDEDKLTSVQAFQTTTKTREEADQDLPVSGYYAIPKSSFSVAKTSTKAREEPEQEVHDDRYSTIPRQQTTP